MKISQIYKETAERNVKDNLKDICALFLINYSGIKAADMNILRESLRQTKAKLFVVKNSVLKRAFSQTEQKDLANFIDGPCGLIFAQDDPVATAKTLDTFRKTHETLKFNAVFLKDKILDAKQIEGLAKLPGREVLLAKAVGAIKSPLYALVFVLNENLRKLVYALEEIRKKRENSNK